MVIILFNNVLQVHITGKMLFNSHGTRMVLLTYGRFYMQLFVLLAIIVGCRIHVILSAEG